MFQNIISPSSQNITQVSDSIVAQDSLSAIDSVAIADSIKNDSLVNIWTSVENFPHRKSTVTDKSKGITSQTPLFTPEIKKDIHSEWPALVLTLVVLLLAFTRAFGLSRFNQIYKSMFSFYASQEVAREERVFFHRVNFSLMIIYIFNLSLLIFYFYMNAGGNFSIFVLFPFILLCVACSYFFKLLFGFLLAKIFSNEQIVPMYSYTVMLYNYFLGILLIPAIALLFFSNFEALIIIKAVVIPLVIIVLIFRFIRFFTLGIYNKISVLYIFLYICTLEILPLVVVGKFLI